MNVCVAGKNNIAIDVCQYVVEHYPQARIYALINRGESGVDGWQKSYLRYIHSDPRVQLSNLVDMYDIDDLVFISTQYDRIIKPNLFKTKYLYNIHFSLLPAYKGMYPSVWPVLNGERYSGVTLHKMDCGIDTGDIIAQRKIRLSAKETSYSLYLKLIEQGTNLVIKYIDNLITNHFKSYQQLAIGSTYYSKKSIHYSDIQIDLISTAAQIDRQIRAFYFPVYQLPRVCGYQIRGTKITNEKSTTESGTVLRETEQWLKISTIDYNIILYKAC